MCQFSTEHSASSWGQSSVLQIELEFRNVELAGESPFGEMTKTNVTRNSIAYV